MGEIDELIAAASEEQRNRRLTSHPKSRGTGSIGSGKISWVSWVLLLVILGAVMLAAAQFFMPVSKSAIHADLETALVAAHDAVEEYRRLNGRLPERLPVTSLANIVHFEMNDTGYRLRATLNGVTLSRAY
jgi:hypothetical protein